MAPKKILEPIRKGAFRPKEPQVVPVIAPKKTITLPDMGDKLDRVRAYVEKEVVGAKLMRYDGTVESVPVTSTGSLSLDYAVGVGGYPHGRIVEVFGVESSGKTTLTLHAIASFQRHGGMAAFIDAEHSLDLKYAQALGVKVEELLVTQPDYGEQALEIVDSLLDEKAFGSGDIIVVDSVAALTPKVEIDGEMGDQHMGVHARLMSQALRKIAGKLMRSGAVLYFTNQVRDKIGVVFGSPTTTTGGNALKFYASLRVKLKKKDTFRGKLGATEDAVIGHTVVIDVVKNKVAPPFVQVEAIVRYGEGISRYDELVDYGVKLGAIELAGSWYSYGGNRLGQGKDSVLKFLREHPKEADELELKIRETMRLR